MALNVYGVLQSGTSVSEFSFKQNFDRVQSNNYTLEEKFYVDTGNIRF